MFGRWIITKAVVHLCKSVEFFLSEGIILCYIWIYLSDSWSCCSFIFLSLIIHCFLSPSDLKEMKIPSSCPHQQQFLTSKLSKNSWVHEEKEKLETSARKAERKPSWENNNNTIFDSTFLHNKCFYFTFTIDFSFSTLICIYISDFLVFSFIKDGNEQQKTINATWTWTNSSFSTKLTKMK